MTKLIVKFPDLIKNFEMDGKYIQSDCINIKLMRLGSPNQINVVEWNLKSEFDRRIMLIRISTIKIESTIGNLIQN